MHGQLISLITKSLQLSNRDRDLCVQYFDPVSYPKNRIIEEEGKVPGHLYFVVSGFARLFHYNDKGDEVTTHINCPPGFITSYADFTNQKKSDENLECITECELLRISKADLDQLIQQSPTFKDFSFLVFQQSLSYNETRAKDLATLDAEQRYLKMMNQYPEVLQNVPMQYIASFLGMNPKSLSRIRKKIIR
jgi:CRP-like cAMP-binding protein